MCEETGRKVERERESERECVGVRREREKERGRWRDPAYLNFSQALTQSTVAVGEDYPAKTNTSPPRYCFLHHHDHHRRHTHISCVLSERE